MSNPSGLERLLEIMRRLRDPSSGCPWDRAQTFESIAPYTIEEAYEVADAVERRDFDAIRQELGDLLFQVVFHARLGQEKGLFDFEAVAQGIADKLTARHPHVFAGASIASAEEQNEQWERHKAEERRAKGLGTLDDVPLALPALSRAEKLGKRASNAGFDWPDRAGPRAAIASELAELDAELAADASDSALTEELGDVLFSVVNLARHLDVDPESALKLANAKFARRFAWVERQVGESGRRLAEVPAAELDNLWSRAKEAM